jgi:hypothetical protein
MRQRSSLHKLFCLRVWALLLPGLMLLAPGKTCLAQTAGPPQLLPDIVILPEQLVAEQWPVMLDTVHPPKELKYIVPGQCVRFAAFASGNGGRELLEKSRYAFELSLAGNAQSFPAEPAQMVKLTTIFMPEFLANTLGRNRIFHEIPPDKALAASGPKARWCVPLDAQDGTASVQGTFFLSDGQTVALKRRKLEIKTFEGARKKTPWKNVEQMAQWIQHFHEAPEPALLLPALRLAAQNAEARNGTNMTEFFVAAFKAYPAAAEELKRRLPAEDRWTRMIGTAMLNWAGYDVASLRDGLPQEDKNALAVATLPDPFDMTPNEQIGARQDMLWAIFFATGRMEPVRAISTALAWSEDYAKLMERGRQMRASGEKPGSGEWPAYAARAAAYGAAGWSMGSLASSDALLSDYIEALKAGPETPAAVKKELENLYKNPAFRMDQPPVGSK